jgi:hypothetical protein
MRRLFYTLGAVSLVIVLGIGGLIGFAAIRGSGADAESKAYVDQAVVDISKNWDQEQLLRRASPGFMKAVSPQQISVLFDQLSKFGPLIHYNGANGQAISFFMLGSGYSVRAHYDAMATCQNGNARLRIDLSKNDGRWMIDSFYVDLSPPPVSSSPKL